jgi:transcriptional regulator with GAF, ATPase, and Fis domain
VASTPTTVWLCFCGNVPAAGAISRSLAEAGLPIAPTLRPAFQGHGILCFSEISHGLFSLLEEAGRRSDRHVIALAARPAALDAGAAWRLLEAGAADVLAWRDPATAEHIQAKLERWWAVDELVVRQVAEAARFADAPILLMGESGTGKELLARVIHHFDGRERRGEMVTVDCTSLVPELSGSELFGHERGAFTGAIASREGAFALADGGTLFLDEVGELSAVLQPQLLRAVQEGVYKRVGGNAWQGTDFRLVCATNRDLEELVGLGQFRSDLYHRLAGWVFRTPRLCDRRQDILPLATHFLRRIPGMADPPEMEEPVQQFLLNREYPGNVRDLRQLVHRIGNRHAGTGPITAGDIPEQDRPVGTASPSWPDGDFENSIRQALAVGAGLRQITEAARRAAIRITVQQEQSLQHAAKRLGVTDRILQKWRKTGLLAGGTGFMAWLVQAASLC